MADILANIRTAHRTAENAVIFCDNKFCDDHPETAYKIAHAWQLLNDLVIAVRSEIGGLCRILVKQGVMKENGDHAYEMVA